MRSPSFLAGLACALVLASWPAPAAAADLPASIDALTAADTGRARPIRRPPAPRAKVASGTVTRGGAVAKTTSKSKARASVTRAVVPRRPAPKSAKSTRAAAAARTSAAARVVVLDPGHGGPVMRGARSMHWPDSVYEADVTYAVATRVRELLTDAGIPVRMTRQSSADGPSLAERAAMCDRNCRLFVSLHVNAMPDDPAPSRGLEAYVPPQRSVRASSFVLARRLTSKVSLATGQPVLRVKQRNLGVLWRATRPAVLFEMGFATHPEEGPWLLEDSTQARLATAIAAAITQTVRGTTPARPAKGVVVARSTSGRSAVRRSAPATKSRPAGAVSRAPVARAGVR